MESSLYEQLIEAAREVVTASKKPQTFSPLVDRYIALFNQWYRTEGPGRADAALDGGEQVKVLQSVQQVHTEVIAAVKESKVKTAGSLRTLKQRGKGILSYIDTLPKHISIRGTRKG